MLIGKAKAVRTPEFNKKMERKKWIRITLFTVLFLVLVGLPIYFLKADRFLITNIEIQGNGVTKDEEIQSIINNSLEEKYLWIFPKSNIILYPKKKIEEDLLQTIPRLKSAKLNLNSSKFLSVAVEERLPKALYCTNVSNPLSPSGCYFIDASGYIFSVAPSFSGDVYFVFSSDPVLEPIIRNEYMESSKFGTLEPFIKSLESIGIYAKVFLYKNEEYNLILSNGGKIMWKAKQDLEKIESNLVSFVTDPSFAKNKYNLNNILYIDLRFGNKVFFKFKDGL